MTIFVDSNVPMYLMGAEHPHKLDARRLVERHLVGGDRLVTDAEVFQEIVHRYAASGRRGAIQPMFDTLYAMVSDVLPIEIAHVERAKELVLGIPRLSSRDALHVAVMEAAAIQQVLSFDADYDAVPGLTRIFR